MRYLVQFLFEQAEAAHRGSEYGHQVVDIGLVARIGRLTELFRGKGMHDPRLKSCLGKRPLDGKMVVPRALDGDDLISNAVLLQRLAELGDGQIETTPRVLDFLGLDQHLTIEIAKHPIRLSLTHIHTNNPESLRTNFPHPRSQESVGLLYASASGSTTLGTGLR